MAVAAWIKFQQSVVAAALTTAIICASPPALVLALWKWGVHLISQHGHALGQVKHGIGQAGGVAGLAAQFARQLPNGMCATVQDTLQAMVCWIGFEAAAAWDTVLWQARCIQPLLPCVPETCSFCCRLHVPWHAGMGGCAHGTRRPALGLASSSLSPAKDKGLWWLAQRP